MGDRRSRSESDRAITPMVGKAMEAGLVVLFLGVMTTGLYAGVVPDYRSATADELGDRALVTAVNEVEAAVPPATDAGGEGNVTEGIAVDLRTVTRVDLPGTLRSQGYTVEATAIPGPNASGEVNGSGAVEGSGETEEIGDTGWSASANGTVPALRLSHPHPSVGGERALALPDRVVAVEGSWTGGGGGRVVVERVDDEETAEPADGLVIRLEDET